MNHIKINRQNRRIENLNLKVNELYDNFFHPRSKRRFSKSFLIGIFLGIFASLIINGFFGVGTNLLQLNAAMNDIGNNITLASLTSFERYTFESNLRYLETSSKFYFISIIMGVFSIILCYILYHKINHYSNLLYKRISFVKYRTYQVVDILREIKGFIKNDEKYYKNKHIKIDDNWDQKNELGVIIFKEGFILPYYVFIKGNIIKIISPNTHKGEKFRDYISKLIMTKRYKTIKSLKEVESGDKYIFF